MVTKIYGASDDLIEIEGAISDEVDAYSGKSFSASDGTNGTIKYEGGEWKINVKNAGEKFKDKIDSVGDDLEHTGEAVGCPSYSDVLILAEGIEWVRIGRRTFKTN